jgi:hypothetical protein
MAPRLVSGRGAWFWMRGKRFRKAARVRRDACAIESVPLAEIHLGSGAIDLARSELGSKGRPQPPRPPRSSAVTL